MLGFEREVEHRTVLPIGYVTAMFEDSKKQKEKSKARKDAEDFSLIFEKECKEVKDG